MMRVLDRLRRLNRVDRLLLVEAALLLGRVRLALWLQPFRRVQRKFSVGTTSATAQRPTDLVDPAQVAAAVRRGARVIPAANCLTQALATRVMLSRRGVPNDMRLGVAKDDQGVLQAHAWVEVDGHVLIGDLPDLGRFARLPHLPGDTA